MYLSSLCTAGNETYLVAAAATALVINFACLNMAWQDMTIGNSPDVFM